MPVGRPKVKIKRTVSFRVYFTKEEYNTFQTKFDVLKEKYPHLNRGDIVRELLQNIDNEELLYLLKILSSKDIF